MRIPLDYLAELFTAGDPRPVELALRRLAAMRSHMRDVNLGREVDEEIAESVGMTGKQLEEMYRLLAIAKYDDRYVIPEGGSAPAPRMEELGINTEGMGDAGYLGEGAPSACTSAIGCGSTGGTRREPVFVDLKRPSDSSALR